MENLTIKERLARFGFSVVPAKCKGYHMAVVHLSGEPVHKSAAFESGSGLALARFFESGFSSPVDLEKLISITGLSKQAAAKLAAAVCDFVAPLPAGLSSVTVRHEHGEYSTDFNSGAGRVGMVDHFYGVTLGIVTGRAGENEDGTPCRVIGLTFNCKQGLTL